MTQETRLPTTMSRDPHLRWRETHSLDVSEREIQRRLSSAADIIREIGALPFEEQPDAVVRPRRRVGAGLLRA